MSDLKKLSKMSVGELKEKALALHEAINVCNTTDLRLLADVLDEINKRSIVYKEVNTLEFSK